MDSVLAGLRAAAEPTRLRLMALCAKGDLTVTEITQILGQSQPRVSRHLKVMVEAGLLDRIREGAWVFYRLASHGNGAQMSRRILELLPPDDPQIMLDDNRLSLVKRARAESAEAYFRDNAAQWDSIRSLHVDDREVERLLMRLLSDRPIGDLLDVGTGTGRLLDLFSARAERLVGLDSSREMLAVARANLEKHDIRNASVRQSDMYRLPFGGPGFDVVLIHQVLHYADDPAAAVAEAARVLNPGGRLAIVDFAPHQLEVLRLEHNHRRLGFSDDEVAKWCSLARLAPPQAYRLPGEPLTVTLWLAAKPDLSIPGLLKKGEEA